MKRSLSALVVLALLATLPTLSFGQDAEQHERATRAAAELEAVNAVLLAQAEAAAAAPDVAVEAADDDTAEATTGAEGSADDAAGDDTADASADPEPAVEQVPPGTLRFHLMDGSIITGKLENDSLPIKTEFGDLVVPITKIVSFAPGLTSHPKLDQRIQQLFQRLGSPNAEERDQAQAELISFGPGLMSELERYADDPDAERKVRVATITEELYAADDGFNIDEGPSVSLVRLDTIVTAQFTVAGSIQQETFNIQSKFGKLVVELKDIKAAERLSTEAPEVRRTVEVRGTDMAGRNWKNSGIKVNRGDRIIITAEGQVTMSPWGSNTISGPDGMPQNGMYNGKIPMGALAGKIGDKGEEMLIGSKKSFVAQRSGTLYLGFAMQQNWANYQFPGKYEARVRVVPAE